MKLKFLALIIIFFLLLYVRFGHPWWTTSRFLTLVLTELLLIVIWRTWSTTSPLALCMHLPGASAEGRFRGKITSPFNNNLTFSTVIFYSNRTGEKINKGILNYVRTIKFKLPHNMTISKSYQYIRTILSVYIRQVWGWIVWGRFVFLIKPYFYEIWMI